MCPDHCWLEAATRGAAPRRADAPTQGPEALTQPRRRCRRNPRSRADFGGAFAAARWL